MDIHNLDCFEYFKKVADKSVNLFVLDLPYTTTNWGKTTACKWDTPIDLEKMWKEIKRIMKKNAVIIFFCNTKFGFNLIQSNQKWFKYDLIWKKSRKVGFLSANKMPLRQHENIYIFKKEGGTYNSQLEEGEPHNRHKYKGHNTTDTYYNVSLPFNVKENKGTRHPTSVLEMGEDSENIYIFKKESGTYNSQLEEGEPYKKKAVKKEKQEIYNDGKELLRTSIENKGTRHPTSVLEQGEDSENIYIFKKESGTYNPQLEEGEPYNKNWKGKANESAYGNFNVALIENKGTRHPTNILEYDNPTKSLHKTQKPTDLLEWLIKSYSNEGDLVCDFTFGSGSTAIACLNTKRRFTGCERDTDIFNIAKQRIEKHEVEQYLLQEEERKQKKIRTKIKEYKKFIEKHS